jgi:DNA-binding beta-propeller fold protein YncE
VLNYAFPNSPSKPALNTIPNVGSGPDRFALNTHTNDMYVSDNTANQVGTASPESTPTEMGYLPSTGLLYVALQGDNEVVAVDPSSFLNS